ncbi:ABC transporter permease [Actinomycetospora sp. CA-101289]|uniref:ABC transporter permease n=1 Tax=Actinomycetospora sp. CA-101289 TaxID=3239893 RepID=UPI003D999830
MNEYFSYLSQNLQQVLFLTQAHFLVVLIAVTIGSAISIVLGMIVSSGEPDPPRYSFDWFAVGIREGSLLITAAALTVPSLALFVLILPLTGFGLTTTVIVLTVYSLYTVLRNTVAGLTSVDRAVLESARGLGYSRMRRLLTIQLPLAWPIILNGIRVTTLITIAITTVAALVQGPGLGTLVLSGLSRIGSANSFPQVITGTVFCLLVAAAFEIFFAIVQRLTIPRGIRV